MELLQEGAGETVVKAMHSYKDSTRISNTRRLGKSTVFPI